MARTVVQKYGGSSVSTPEKLGLVADRVARLAQQGDQVCVVISAMGKTTDELIALAKRVAESPPRRELDMLTSTGERISMALLAMALSARGVDAISFTGSQSGIMTNDRHSGARIIEVRPIRIEDELARGRVVIVAGFQGMSYRREITTLGRGGSDTTAVALAAALGADCEIYSDVDGVYSADPRVVPDAHHLAELDYETMQELAEHGAKVLNAAAVEFARKQGITIYARQTTGSDKQTRITGDAPSAHAAQAVAGLASYIELAFAVENHQILETLVAARAPLLSSRAGRVALVKDDLPDWSRIAAELAARGATLTERGLVSVIGPGVGADPELLRRVLTTTVAHATLHDHAATPRRISVVVDPAAVAPVTRALHAACCEPPL